MTITPTGQATIRSKDDGQRYVIQAKDIEWNQVSADERKMGLEVEYLGQIEHPELGRLTWSVWEYPIGMFNDSDQDVNGHMLEANFAFDPQFERDEDWDDFEANEELANLTDDQLRALPKEQQEEYIVAWFHSQFWDPAQETPYNGREGATSILMGDHMRREKSLKTNLAALSKRASSRLPLKKSNLTA